MLKTRNYITRPERYLKLSNFKLISGILIFLGYSFSFYSFLYILRETFRLYTVFNASDLLILSEKEVNYFNFIFALISVIIGQSLVFVYWFDAPRSWKQKRTIYNLLIINDQRVLLYSFLSWIFKLSFLFAVIFGLMFSGGYYVFSLYPNYNFLFVLIIVVLYLHSWTSLNFIYKKSGQKWMVMNALIIVVVAFAYSKVNLINYNKINQSHLIHSLKYKYPIQLYESDEYELSSRSHLIKEIYIAKSNDFKQSLEPIIFVDNKVISKDELKGILFDWKSNLSSFYSIVACKLYVDVNVPIKYVNLIKNEISSVGISKVLYAVVPSSREYDIRYYTESSISLRIPVLNLFGFPPINNFNKSNTLNIQHHVNELHVNNIAIQDPGSLQNVFKNFIHKNPISTFEYFVSDEILFGEYLHVYEVFKLAIKQEKEEFALLNYFESYENLDLEIQMEIDKYYSINWIEKFSDVGFIE